MDILLYGVLSIAAAALLFASATLLRSGVTHLFTREDVRRDAEAHSPESVMTVVKGEVCTYKHNDRRDASIAAGMVRDRKTGRFHLQGRVSDEVLEPLV